MAGHVWRCQEQIIEQVAKLIPENKRSRPRQRWADRVEKDLSMLGKFNGEERATNRDRWRGVIVAAKNFNGLH